MKGICEEVNVKRYTKSTCEVVYVVGYMRGYIHHRALPYEWFDTGHIGMGARIESH